MERPASRTTPSYAEPLKVITASGNGFQADIGIIRFSA
jgi:hypothetical protein